MKRQTLIWTPELDRRRQSPLPTEKRTEVSISLPHMTADPPVPQICRSTSPQTTNTKQVKRLSQKQERRNQLELRVKELSEQHRLYEPYAHLLALNQITLERALELQARRERKQRTRLAREQQSEAKQKEQILLQNWISTETPLIRIGSGAPICAFLIDVSTYQFHWSDQSEPSPKLETFVVMPLETWESWGKTWEVDEELAGRGLLVPENFGERRKPPRSQVKRAYERDWRAVFKFLNGRRVVGSVAWWHYFGTWICPPETDDRSCGCLAMLHGIFSVWPWRS